MAITERDGSGSGPLTAAHAVSSPLALHALRSPGMLVGRPAEVTAIEQELGAASSRLVGVTLEGEPGIGKTRLLLAAADLAIAGLTTIGVNAGAPHGLTEAASEDEGYRSGIRSELRAEPGLAGADSGRVTTSSARRPAPESSAAVAIPRVSASDPSIDQSSSATIESSGP